MKIKHLILTLSIFIAVYGGNKGFGSGKQDFGYIDVRNGSHMFWWLFHTTATVSDSSERPLIMWLQGGPGGSSTGVGNFYEIGPLDEYLKPREHTWVKDFNVLFVDNPVGSGFSYVDNESYLTTNNHQIALDLLELMKEFYRKFPQFKKTPFYIYGQSYGGKMAIEFSKLLYDEMKVGNIQSNISGIAMGNSWISPVDSVLSYASYLYQVSLIDENEEMEIKKQALYLKEVFDDGKYKKASEELVKMERIIIKNTHGVDIYNIINKPGVPPKADLHILMNGDVKKSLNIPTNVVWKSNSRSVKGYLMEDFMIPVINIVESVLKDTPLKVHVYNGNLDLLVDTPGQLVWVNKLKWDKAEEFKNAPKKPIIVNNILEGYKKSAGKFSFYWINVAGHSVPADNPVGSRVFLEDMTGF